MPPFALHSGTVPKSQKIRQRRAVISPTPTLTGALARSPDHGVADGSMFVLSARRCLSLAGITALFGLVRGCRWGDIQEGIVRPRPPRSRGVYSGWHDDRHLDLRDGSVDDYVGSGSVFPPFFPFAVWSVRWCQYLQRPGELSVPSVWR